MRNPVEAGAAAEKGKQQKIIVPHIEHQQIHPLPHDLEVDQH